MKVAFIHNSAFTFLPMRGGLVRAVQSRGHQVVACLPGPETDLVDPEKFPGLQYRFFRLKPTGMNPLEDLRFFWNLRTFFDEYQPDLVFSTTVKPIIYGALAAHWSKCRPPVAAMVNGLGYAFLPHGFRDRILTSAIRRLYRMALKRVSIVFFQNPDDREVFNQFGWLLKSHKIIQINGSGVDVSRFSFRPPQLSPISFLYIGRLVKDKGVVEFVDAIRLVKKRFPEVKGVLVGYLDSHPTGVKMDQLSKWISEGVIDYLGSMVDVRPPLEASSVFVLPSYREGTSRAVLEAMATGRPIITTDVPGCRQTVKQRVNGFLVPPKNVPDLADAMCRFIENPCLISQMGNESRKFAEAQFDMAKVNAKILESLQL